MDTLDAVMVKIRKLLALSKSSNEHEAANAATRAAELMLQHKIEMAQLDAKDAQDDGQIHNTVMDPGEKKTRRKPGWKGVIAVGVAEGTGCRTYFDRYEGLFRLIGRKAETQTASYLYAHLIREVERLGSEAYKREFSGYGDAAHARSWQTSFKVGCASTIQRRLREQREQAMGKMRKAPSDSGAGKALMVIKNDVEAIDRYCEENLKLKANRPVQARRIDAFYAGREAGERVSLGGGRGLGAPAKRIGGGS